MKATSEQEAVLMLTSGHDITILHASSGVEITVTHTGFVLDHDCPEGYRYGAALYSAAIKLGQLLSVVPPGVLEQFGGRARLANALILVNRAESYLP